MENFKFWEAGWVGVKLFGPKYQKSHPYTKSGWINRLAYVPVSSSVLTLCETERKNHATTPIHCGCYRATVIEKALMIHCVVKHEKMILVILRLWWVMFVVVITCSLCLHTTHCHFHRRCVIVKHLQNCENCSCTWLHSSLVNLLIALAYQLLAALLFTKHSLRTDISDCWLISNDVFPVKIKTQAAMHKHGNHYHVHMYPNTAIHCLSYVCLLTVLHILQMISVFGDEWCEQNISWLD